MTTESPDRPSRVEREIREILEQADARRSPVDRLGETAQRRSVETRQRFQRGASGLPTSRMLTPEIMRILGALALAMAGALLSDVSRLLGIVAGIASLIIFFSLWFPGSRTTSSQAPRWRGRDLR